MRRDAPNGQLLAHHLIKWSACQWKRLSHFQHENELHHSLDYVCWTMFLRLARLTVHCRVWRARWATAVRSAFLWDRQPNWPFECSDSSSDAKWPSQRLINNAPYAWRCLLFVLAPLACCYWQYTASRCTRMVPSLQAMARNDHSNASIAVVMVSPNWNDSNATRNTLDAVVD